MSSSTRSTRNNTTTLSKTTNRHNLPRIKQLTTCNDLHLKPPLQCSECKIREEGVLGRKSKSGNSCKQPWSEKYGKSKFIRKQETYNDIWAHLKGVGYTPSTTDIVEGPPKKKIKKIDEVENTHLERKKEEEVIEISSICSDKEEKEIENEISDTKCNEKDDNPKQNNKPPTFDLLVEKKMKFNKMQKTIFPEF
jgi:hypothetical protein